MESGNATLTNHVGRYVPYSVLSKVLPDAPDSVTLEMTAWSRSLIYDPDKAAKSTVEGLGHAVFGSVISCHPE